MIAGRFHSVPILQRTHTCIDWLTPAVDWHWLDSGDSCTSELVVPQIELLQRRQLANLRGNSTYIHTDNC